ncbi:GNAT family N-acetyltransferase [Aquisphaera insulae]|uniref:GNAT family N-acetyltransferase n=1 Tax=Aquisphaera insulae TaxID=2712864 RepID=UPI0013EB67B9|nr:GNAT family N-acetyltransferase [Aquisphaera insulae]
MTAPERLETERLELRMFRESDLDAYAAMCADPEVMRHLGDGQPMTRSEAWRSMATVLGHWRLRGFGLWAVVDRGGGELAGRVGLWRPEGWPGIELAWTLRREFWGRGLATEAAVAALGVAFGPLAQSHVISMISSSNGPSIRVARRLGMRLEGRTTLLGQSAEVHGIRRRIVPIQR